MLSFSKLALLLATALMLSACESPDRYPISGEACGPDDPVKTIDSSMADCVPQV